MSYTVLARKYRSQTFDDVVGQDPISQTLKNAIKNSKVAHAYLFCGTRGVGKTTMARILAKSLNCLSTDLPTTKPCCKCDSCTAINTGEDIDVIEIDGASNNRVDEIRELRENAIYRPARARYKIYIIDEVHMLTVSAFNALLKILEEPPDHIKFIFATTEPNKVIATIQSRCQRFDFNNIAPDAIAAQLKEILKLEKIKYEDDLLLYLAKMAKGSMRDGLSLLDRLISTGIQPLTINLLEEFLGCPNSEKVHNLLCQIAESNAAGTLSATEDLIATGLSELQIAEALIDSFRDITVIKSAGKETKILALTAEQRKRLAELTQKFDTAALVYNITTLEKLQWTLKNSETARALLDASMLRFALSEHFLNVDDLLCQLQSARPDSLKKKPLTHKPNLQTYETADKPSQTEPVRKSELSITTECNDLESIKNNWENLLKIMADELGKSTAGLLNSASPAHLQENTLVLTFPHSAQIQKQMCESNGRIEKIQAFLSKYLKRDLKLKFEIADQKDEDKNPKENKSVSQIQNEIVNDPAVKTVLRELGATITGFEKNQNS